MRHRVFGIEHEYTLTGKEMYTSTSLAIHLLGFLPYAVPLDEVLRQERWDSGNGLRRVNLPRDPRDLYSGRKEKTDMLVNQARAYYDPPNPEYATQECDDIFDLIACEKAGEKHLSVALTALHKTPGYLPTGGSARLFKSNRAFKALYGESGERNEPGALVSEHAEYENKFSSCGTHENYLIMRAATEQRLQQLFLPHLIALSLFAGGGCVEFSQQKKHFEFSRSQRFPWMRIGVGTLTKGARCFLVFRNAETFAPFGPYRRMQVISGDANLCESALLIKYATSAALLEMLEDDSFFAGVLEPILSKKFAWTAENEHVRNVAHAVTTAGLDAPLPTPGYVWTLRDLATFFAELRQKYNELVGFTEDRCAGLHLEQKLLKMLAEHPDTDESEILLPYSDHAFMKQSVDHDMSRFGYSYMSPPEKTIDVPKAGGGPVPMTVSHRFRYLEAVCHELDPGVSRFERAQQRGIIRRVVTPEKIDTMMAGAPTSTRAHRRKMIADELRRNNRLKTCHWTGIIAKNPGEEWDLTDPFVSEPTLEDLRKIQP
ncbi:MAG: hypothetical protein A2676_04275 [Candidatus Sungbacteria bacterium RIFCSPHIGHO2_01_FULL_51_22]|uniref:Uncharacterized protein n=1 Tax=Candidatus Sungbacteria bacterium RIFCSPHIGHO2_02_FULL_51_29 TaxID=1802273 RepID=A0A1G2KUM7_9BACT|nr:MAG: hypothetical protein A2676_04275 [Candidatus Sungbacteria bacterium RIFCSPHIGHO2_01_FULL_51_22]OHA03148.1 MAG: hypothetical protein A3C16_01740 [Candidatus Sungbacteria bacterium RIFCSPHIGHO2_02_FULL_51_29]OHA04794.1 MAG: hypothetical protein A3B29_03300 [Candidatus Sungbacteria bacterium RIFCSPLOWO2_01_FULL_51_34]